MPVSLEKPPAAPRLPPQPGQNPAEFLDPAAMPDVYTTPNQLSIPHGEVQAIGEMATWAKNAEDSRQLTDVVTGKAGIDELGHQAGYMVSELPTSLPIGTRDERLEDEQSRMKSWAEMDVAERSMYADLSESAITHTVSVPFDLLRPETKQTILANRSFDIHTKSKDPTEMQKASERNADRVRRGEIFQPGDLIHTASASKLGATLENGLMGRELLGNDLNEGKVGFLPYNLHLTALDSIPTEIHQDSYKTLLSKTARYANNVGIVIDRSEGATDLNNEIDTSNTSLAGSITGHELIFGGVPSTEIAAICTLPPEEIWINENGRGEHEAEQTTLQAVDAVLAHGVYIPVLNHKGELVLNKEEFDARRSAHGYGDFTRQDFVTSADEPTGPHF